MLARISTVFDTTPDRLWDEVTKPDSLRFVSAPILSFQPLKPGELDAPWVIGKTYQLKLTFLNFIPLGRHDIEIVKIDRESNTIVSNEGSALAPVWNHIIHFRQVGEGKIRYTDEIEIQAGWRTPFIWAFAHLFYRHRQRRWRTLLEGENE